MSGMSKIVTLLTDFGLRDGYVAQMKGRILSGAPKTGIIDITHDVPAYGIRSAAWLIARTYGYFPAGSIHLVVVDPGVGTSRAALLVRKDGHSFIGPDNGVFSFLYPAEKIWEITWRPSGAIAPTFHGRDLFAPAVVKMLDGYRPEELGLPKTDPVAFDIHMPQVVHIDSFGNIITNIPWEQAQGQNLIISGRIIDQHAKTFADIVGEKPAIICGSAGTAEIVLREASAAAALKITIGTPITHKNP